MLARLQSWLNRLLSGGVILLVQAYRWTLRPVLLLLFGPCCRFQPSCSEYLILAVRKHGVLRGVLKGMWRVLRCHPWSPGGFDPP